MVVFSKWVLYFFIYSFLGWGMEVCLGLINQKKFINRGFLIGPYCPIYGIGVLTILFIIGQNTQNVLIVFLKAIAICIFVEYSTSFLMEKIFHIRWWDYSNKTFNINGRICLETMLPFGIMASLVIYFVHPFFEKLINFLNPFVIISLASIFLIIYFVDIMITLIVLIKIKNHVKRVMKDNTEEIKELIQSWLMENTFLYKRFVKAFNRFEIRIKNKIKKLTD